MTKKLNFTYIKANMYYITCFMENEDNDDFLKIFENYPITNPGL